jgi:ubiquinone/menaquinone biosynthesis C-methylase UbiE
MKGKTVFDYQAQAGLTKHMGGLAATEKLIRMCGIDADHEVLEVGCGVGQTSALIAERTGCRLIGLDISEGMLEFARRRARSAGVADRTEFRLGDITDLPFEDERFDVVFGESITVFAPDHAKALEEYVRVVKPGGAVGINEVAWLKTPVPPEFEAWLSQDLAAGSHTRSVESWQTLLETVGMRVESVEANAIDVREETRGLLQRYGLGGMLGVFGRILRMYIRDPEYRSFVRESQEGGLIPENLSEYVGYCLLVARKPLPAS